MKNILITGGAGFIGSNIALELKNKGYNVRVLDNLSPQIHGAEPLITSPLYQSIINEIEFIKGSVTSKGDWIRALDGQEAVIHLAAETGTGQSMYEIQRYIDVNVGGTAIFLDTLTNNQHKVKKIIVASSRAIYGEGKYLCKEHGIVYPDCRKEQDMANSIFDCKCTKCDEILELLPTSEDSRINPASIYGITKQNQEQMFLAVGKALNIPAVAFRYQNVYGPGQSLSNPYTGILSIFTSLMRNGEDINIFEDGKESRDFVYIKDVVNATVLGLENDHANFEVFNIGTAIPTDVITVANVLKSAYNSDSKINITGNYRVGDIRHNYADISKANSILSYEPTFNFETGIRYFTKWAMNIPKNTANNYEKSLLEMKSKGLLK